jgi:twitching motility protein PilJ
MDINNSNQILQQTETIEETPAQQADIIKYIPLQSDQTEISESRVNIDGTSIKTKLQTVAIALATIPVLLLGGVAYKLVADVNNSLQERLIESGKITSLNITNNLASYMSERYREIAILSKSTFLSDEKLRDTIAPAEKQSLFGFALKNYAAYQNIAILDLQGNVIFQTSSAQPSEREKQIYSEQISKLKVIEYSEDRSVKDSGIYLVAPIQDNKSKIKIATIVAHLKADSLDNLVAKIENRAGETYYWLNQQGKIFLSSNRQGNKELVEKSIVKAYQELKQANQPLTVTNKNITNIFIPLEHYNQTFKIDLPNLGWSSLVRIEPQTRSANEQILPAIIWMTIVTSLIAAWIASRIASGIADRAIETARKSEKLVNGKLDNLLPVEGDDELTSINYNFNEMAKQIKHLLVLREDFTTESKIFESSSEVKIDGNKIQDQIMKFVTEIEGVLSGDLTIKAEADSKEIGIVVDFFNSLVERTKEIVSNVKNTTLKINSGLAKDEQTMLQLHASAVQKTEKLQKFVELVEMMKQTLQQVAERAKNATEMAEKASRTARSEEETIERTVNAIAQLKNTVGETSRSVKRLGEASQQIAKSIDTIDKISLKTKYLAVNAGIEAARAGEEARGFAVVAEEVGELAAQSALASKEIQKIIETIQKETSLVVRAMEIGTKEVGEGTRLVQESKENLSKIFDVADRIDRVVQLIFEDAISQTENSQVLNRMVEEIDLINKITSDSTLKVSNSLQETAKITKQLENSVDNFKIEPDRESY